LLKSSIPHRRTLLFTLTALRCFLPAHGLVCAAVPAGVAGCAVPAAAIAAAAAAAGADHPVHLAAAEEYNDRKYCQYKYVT